MFFKKKENKEEEENPAKEKEEESTPKEEDVSYGDMISRLRADVDKLIAQFSSFYEMQKANTERFTRINEQVGELRAMIVERDKDAQRLEAKATQAIDMVETVQPDKLMIELRKGDTKIEALRAELESREIIMNNIVAELKDMRNRMNLFKGTEQVMKLNEEVKGELMDIRTVKAVVERHADKVETIFSEMQKRFSNFERFGTVTEELDKSFKQMVSDFDSIKIKIANLVSKEEMEKLIAKFDDFEKHYGNVVSLFEKKFEKLEKEFNKRFSEKFEKADKLITGFEKLAEKTPDLDKYFHLLEEEAKKIPLKDIKVEKIKVAGEKPEEPKEENKKEGFLDKLKGKFKKEEKK
jgi:hypothetical protein